MITLLMFILHFTSFIHVKNLRNKKKERKKLMEINPATSFKRRQHRIMDHIVKHTALAQ